MKIFFRHICSLLPALLIITSFLPVSAQNRFPEPGPLFDNSSLARVDIAIDPDSLAMFLDPVNVHSDHEYMAVFTFTRGAYSETIDSVGFRLRGNTSRHSAKKSFKVSLNTFIRGQKFHGVEKINLNGEHNDPSMSRALLSWYLFRKAGVPGSRANHVRLYINGEYKGLYINVEHVDEEFTDLRYGSNDGNLFKCLWPADLTYLGESPDSYKFDHDGRRAYELKQNTDDDYSDLASFIDILNNTSTQQLPDDLNRMFNINVFLKYYALEVLTGHWDAYAFNKNNYYLYHNPGTGKFEFIPYDPDNTFGIAWNDIDWMSRDIYNWENDHEYRPLVERIFQEQVFRDRYSFYMNRFLMEFYHISHLAPLLDSIRNQVSEAAEEDQYRTLDYGYSYNDFYNAFESAAGNHVRTGIKPFISGRRSAALSQLTVNPVDPIITLLYLRGPVLQDFTDVQFLVEDDQEIRDVSIWFARDEGDFEKAVPLDLGSGHYRAVYPNVPQDAVLRFYMEATDEAMNTSRDPVEGWYSVHYGLTGREPVVTWDQDGLLISPNPVSALFRVRLPQWTTAFTYRVFDASGRIMMQGEGRGAGFAAEVDGDLPGGLYFVDVECRGPGQRQARFSEKMMVNH